MTVEHVNLTGSQLHEPKGVSAASAGQLGFASSNAVSWSNLVGQQSATASTSSELTFANLDDYLMVRLTFVNLLRATAFSTLSMQFSSDNGSTWYSTANYENWSTDSANYALSAAGTAANLSGDSTAIGYTYTNGVVEVCNLNSTIETSWYGHMLSSSASGATGSTTNQLVWGVMDYPLTTAWNAIRIFSSSGNLTSGSVYLEGFKGT